MNKYVITHEQVEQLASFVAMKPWHEANPLMALLDTIVKKGPCVFAADEMDKAPEKTDADHS